MPVAAELALADGRAQSSVACWPRGCIRAGLSSEIPMNVLDTRPDVDANWRTQQFEGAIESATRLQIVRSLPSSKLPPTGRQRIHDRGPCQTLEDDFRA